MNAITPPHRVPRRVLGAPQPAGRAATEDRGQRYEEDKSASDLSDTYPAGQTPDVSRVTPRSGGTEARQTPDVSRVTPRSGGTEARHVWGRGEAVGGVPDRPSSRSDSTFTAVPVKEMEPRGGSPRRANSSGRARRDVSLDVRLTTGEREAIRDRARVLGVKPSAWARAVMLDALDQRHTREASMVQTSREKPAPELAGAVEQLRRVGVNLNTTLRKGRAVDTSLLRAVLGAVAEVRASLGDRTST